MKSWIYDGIGEGNLLLISGVHGNEYTPIEALFQLEKDEEYTNQLLKTYKKVTFLHAVNEHGIKNNVRDYDANTDLNRIFSVDTIKNDLIEHVFDADYVIDIHSSKDCTEFVLLNNNEYVKSYIKYCDDNDIKYAVWEGSDNTIKSYAIKNNKIAFTVECNGLNTVNHKSLLKTMKLIKKLTLNKMRPPVASSTLESSQLLKTITSPNDGILVWTDKNSFFIRGLNGSVLYSFVNGDYNIILRNTNGFVQNGHYIFQHQPKIEA